MTTFRSVPRAAAWALALGLCALAADRPAPAFAESHSTSITSHHGDGYAYGSVSDDDAAGGAHEAFQYALVEPGDHGDISVSERDSWPEVQRAQREARRLGRRVFWFRLHGRAYVVTDLDLTARAAKMLEPIQEIGAWQGKLGAEQGRWGAEQGRLGAIEGRIGALQARVALAAALRGRDAGDDADLDALQREVADLRVEARQMGDEQHGLGERQRELARKQGELGRQQGARSRAAFRDLRALAKQAVASGRAETF